MKKSLLWLMPLLIIIIIFAVKSLQAKSGKVELDSWELSWNKKQPPAEVIKALGIKPGMTVGEFGAGWGRYAVQIADFLGPKGKFYANDINERALRFLDNRCKRDGLKNLVTTLGTLTDPKFPKGQLDVVYCINTYHHIDQPVELLKNIIPALKPNGILAIIEHEPGKAQSMGNHCTPKETVLKQAKDAGYKLVRIETFLELDNIYIFKAN